MADDSKHQGHEPEDDITRMMIIIGALLFVSMAVGYFLAW